MGNPALCSTEAAMANEVKRACGSCTECCKPFGVPEVAKMDARLCTHCEPGKGCKIYESRPERCRLFYCSWWKGKHSFLRESDHPNILKIVMDEEVGMIGEARFGVLNLWETKPGALQQPRIAEIANAAINEGLIVAYRRLEMGGATYRTELRFPSEVLQRKWELRVLRFQLIELL